MGESSSFHVIADYINAEAEAKNNFDGKASVDEDGFWQINRFKVVDFDTSSMVLCGKSIISSYAPPQPFVNSFGLDY